MSAYGKYYCSAECDRNICYGREGSSYFTLHFTTWALAHPEYVSAHGRHCPDEIPCPACGAPAYRKHTKGYQEYTRRQEEKWRLENEARQAEEAAMLAEARAMIKEMKAPPPEAREIVELDPSRIYLLSRGQARDVTERFRSAV